MANAIAKLIVNQYPYGYDVTERRARYDGLIQVQPGNYIAGGIPLLISTAVSAPGGGSVAQEWLYSAPVSGYANGNNGLYDYNVTGLASLVNGAPPAFCSNVVLTSNVVTVTSVNSFVANQQVQLSNFTGATFLNGQTVTILSTGLSAAQFEFNFTNANYSSTADVGLACLVPASQPPVLTYITNIALTSNVVTATANNTLVAGQQIALYGFAINTFLNNQVVTVSTATATSFTFAFTHANVTSIADPGSAQIQLTFLRINPQAGVTNTASTASAFSITSNVVTMTATNTFVAGETVLLQGFSTATYFNGAVVTILSAGLSGSQYEFNFVHANTSGSDTGTATRTDITAGAAVPLAVTNDTINFAVEYARG